MPYDMTNKSAGDEISSTYEGRHVEALESDLTHPSHTDGFVDKGDACIMGDALVGVALSGAAAATDIIALDTEGLWALSVVGSDDDGNSAVARGDRIYINTTTCVLSKIRANATQRLFGIAASTLTGGTTGVVAVKVHQDPNVINTEDIVADAIDGTLIADDAVDSEHIVDGAIDTAHLADQAVTSVKMLMSIQETAVDITLDADDAGMIIVTADGKTVTLPEAAEAEGVMYIIKTTATHSDGLIVDAYSSETIDGATTKTSPAQYATITIVCDGTDWHVLSYIGTWT
jgi:hypothetical protein